MSDDSEVDDGRRYRAPALEKGLDILELLSSAGKPLTAAAIVQALGRSTGELFRMIQVLEYRGFIEQIDNEGYRLTGKLFALGLEQAPVKSLNEVALPVMRQLSREIGQSCHLAIHSNGQIIVVARVESSEQIGFAVRVGYSRALHHTASGVMLYAFQPEVTRRQWEGMFNPSMSKSELIKFRQRADEVRRQGFIQAESEYVAGITDLSAPVLRGDLAEAALTIPFVHSRPLRMAQADATQHVKAAAKEISSQLVNSD